MRRWKKLVSSALMIFIMLLLSCSVTVTGRVSMKGNDPYLFTVITGPDNREFLVTGDQKKRIAETMQGKTITVKGTISEPRENVYGQSEINVTEILSVSEE
jgi:hypothetical protein